MPKACCGACNLQAQQRDSSQWGSSFVLGHVFKKTRGWMPDSRDFDPAFTLLQNIGTLRNMAQFALECSRELPTALPSLIL